ncbi:MAG: hypothetical protein HY319_28955 [Armatimonadetes bacterium]|nr:hypothetical protein [Armatimonadota bacterium]
MFDTPDFLECPRNGNGTCQPPLPAEPYLNGAFEAALEPAAGQPDPGAIAEPLSARDWLDWASAVG